MPGPFDHLDQKAFDDIVFQAAAADAKPGAPPVITHQEFLALAKRMPPPRPIEALHVAPGLLEAAGGELAVRANVSFIPGMPVVVDPALPPGEWRLVPRWPALDRPILSPAAPPVPTDDGFRISLRTDIPPFTATLADLGLDEPQPTRWQRFKAWMRRLLGRA